MTSTGFDRLGAVGHGRDGLGPAHPVDLVDPGHRRGGQGGVVDPAVGPGRHAQDDLLDAGHLGGHRAHQHGRRIAGPPAGRVAPGPRHRPDQVADLDAAGLEVVGRPVARLVGVVGQDPVVGHVEGLLELGRAPGARAAWISSSGTRSSSMSTPSNCRVSRRSGGVAVGPYLVEDGGHVAGDRSCSSAGRGSASSQRPATAGEAAEIEATESHSPSMLPDPGPPLPDSGTGPARRRRAGASSGAMIVRWPPAPQNSRRSPPPSTS